MWELIDDNSEVDPGWLAFPRGEQPKGALLAEKQGNLRGAAAVPGDAVAEAPSTAMPRHPLRLDTIEGVK